MATISFICRECKPEQKFTVERQSADTNKLGKVFCPGCGREWGTGVKIELDFHPATTSRSSAAVGKENTEMSRDAQERARSDRDYLDRTDPEVQPGVRQSSVDKINRKMGEFLNS